MSLYVIDASVAAKWFLPAAGEPLSEEAAGWLRRYVKDEVRFVLPDLFWAELANVLWKAARQGRCTKMTARRAVTAMQEFNLPTVPSQLLLDEALALAFAFDRSVYDCLYVALALRSKAQLVTADERLANALAARLPVKWLGAVS